MSPTVGLLVVSCGRPQYLAPTLASAAQHLRGINGPRLIVDDSGNPEFHGQLRRLTIAKDYNLACHRERSGLSAAVQTGWDQIGDCDYIFHLEDDFTFPHDVPVDHMVGLLDAIPELAQMALVRNPAPVPWEQAHGGFIQADPDAYVPRAGYEEHVKLFTLNPCVYPRWVTDVGWPRGGGEREFTDRLVEKHPEVTFGFLGSREDPPRCIHIGHQRVEGWKL